MIRNNITIKLSFSDGEMSEVNFSVLPNNSNLDVAKVINEKASQLLRVADPDYKGQAPFPGDVLLGRFVQENDEYHTVVRIPKYYAILELHSVKSDE